MLKKLSRLKKLPSRLARNFILKLEFVDTEFYMKKYLKWLKKRGVVINGTPNYISNTVYFDGSDFSMIELGDGCTISREVMFLTHDYAMHTAFRGLKDDISADAFLTLSEIDKKNKLLEQRKIVIGSNSFIGARSSLLPGTVIGNNCIVGSGCVVKGIVPDNSIVIGNPAKIIKKTSDWLEKKAQQLKESNKNG